MGYHNAFCLGGRVSKPNCNNTSGHFSVVMVSARSPWFITNIVNIDGTNARSL